MHSPHSVQVNILRLRVRGFSRMGQALSQALLQLLQALARLVSKPTTMARGLAIQARLWKSPTAQAKRQKKWRASKNSTAKATVPAVRKMVWLRESWPVKRLW